MQFRVRYNSIAPNSPKDTKLYACCGNLAVHMADGTVTLNLTSVTFNGSVGGVGFTVPYDKILTSELQLGGRAPRLHIRVLTRDHKGLEAPTSYYLYHPDSMGSGDVNPDGPGAAIICDLCDFNPVGQLDFLIHVARRGSLGPSVSRDTDVGTGSAMTNGDVVKLVTAGLSIDVILNAIRQAERVHFDVSLSGLVALKEANVPEAVVLAMQTKAGGGADQEIPGSVASVNMPSNRVTIGAPQPNCPVA